VAIDALADVGAPEDAARIAPFAADPSPRVRAAALRAIARLDFGPHAALFGRALRDPSPRVLRAAFAALRKHPYAADRAALDDLIASRSPSAWAAFALLVRGDYWDAILVSLRAARDPALTKLATGTLAYLCERQCYTSPEDLAALERAWTEARPVLPDGVASRLHTILSLQKK